MILQTSVAKFHRVKTQRQPDGFIEPGDSAGSERDAATGGCLRATPGPPCCTCQGLYHRNIRKAITPPFFL